MQVAVKEQLPLLIEVLKELSGAVDRGLVLETWIDVQPVKVVSLSVHSVMASVDPIRVQHWNDFEHKRSPQLLCFG